MIKFALSGKSLVFAGDYEKGMDCTCLFCGEKVIGRNSNDSIPEHFFHKNNNPLCHYQKASKKSFIEGLPYFYSGKRYKSLLRLKFSKIKRTEAFSKLRIEVLMPKEIEALDNNSGFFGICTIFEQEVPILIDYGWHDSDTKTSDKALAEMGERFDFFLHLGVHERDVTYQEPGYLKTLFIEGSSEKIETFQGNIVEREPTRDERFPQFYCVNFAPKPHEQSLYFEDKYINGFATLCYFSYRVLDYAIEPCIKRSEFMRFYLDQTVAKRKWRAINDAISKINWFLEHQLSIDNYYFGDEVFSGVEELTSSEIGIFDSRPFRTELYKKAPVYMKKYFKEIDELFDDIVMGEDNPYKKSFKQRWGI